MQQPIHLVIQGEPGNKSNSRRIVKFGNTPALIKSKKAEAYAPVFLAQCPILPRLMTGILKASVHIHYASERPDLDAELLFDLMQKRIYLNDRQVREKHLFHHIDREHPRAEITISER